MLQPEFLRESSKNTLGQTAPEAIIGDIGLTASDLPSPSTLCEALDRINIGICRVFLRRSARLHDPSKQGAIDIKFYERSAVSRYYCQRISYFVQKMKVTKLADTESQAALDLHSSTNRKTGDANFAERIVRWNVRGLRSLAANHDKKSLQNRLRYLGIRPLIKHRIFAPYDHAHNVRIDENATLHQSV